MHSSLPQQLENFDFSSSRLLKGIFDALERFVLRGTRGRSSSSAAICAIMSRARVRRTRPCSSRTSWISPISPPRRRRRRKIARVRAEVAPAGEKIVLYAGNFEPYQGIPLLIESFARVKSKAVLLIVGGVKAEHDAARAAAGKLGAGGRIAFVEKVAPQKVPLYVAASDVLVSPRVSGTNTPLKIYSFLKAGKPFVATKLWTHTQVARRRGVHPGRSGSGELRRRADARPGVGGGAGAGPRGEAAGRPGLRLSAVSGKDHGSAGEMRYEITCHSERSGAKRHPERSEGSPLASSLTTL